jgi:hypothetical protein
LRVATVALPALGGTAALAEPIGFKAPMGDVAGFATGSAKVAAEPAAA